MDSPEPLRDHPASDLAPTGRHVGSVHHLCTQPPHSWCDDGLVGDHVWQALPLPLTDGNHRDPSWEPTAEKTVLWFRSFVQEPQGEDLDLA
ncbi:hypothetical protein [Streptomyces sp. NPDC058745]|uniref:hypothetical protein n=1 Tax=Streptomyces sp. NPDC058745 TaxID=3346621 RepID=UPI0036CD8922